MTRAGTGLLTRHFTILACCCPRCSHYSESSSKTKADDGCRRRQQSIRFNPATFRSFTLNQFSRLKYRLLHSGLLCVHWSPREAGCPAHLHYQMRSNQLCLCTMFGALISVRCSIMFGAVSDHQTHTGFNKYSTN